MNSHPPLEFLLAPLRRMKPLRASTNVLYLVLALAASRARIPGIVHYSASSLAVLLHWRPQTVRSALTELETLGTAGADDANELVWVPDAARSQPPYSSREIASWGQHWAALPECELRHRIATDMRELLAARGPTFAAAFEAHCLKTRPVPARVTRPVPESPPAPHTPKSQKTETDNALWEGEFAELWALYPKRAGSNPKSDALRCYVARRRNDKIAFEDIRGGLERYRRFCEATQKIGTENVLQAVTFFGPSKRFAEEYALPKGHTISLDLETSPAFERVLAAYPRQDGKADAWKVWQRVDPAPDTAVVEQMLVSIPEWKKYQWPPGKEAFVLTFAKWLEGLSWRRKFKQNGGRSFEETVARFGAVSGSSAGNVYDGEAVACDTPKVAPMLPFASSKRPDAEPARSAADPFDLAPISARR